VASTARACDDPVVPEVPPELGRGLHDVAVGLLLWDRLDVAAAVELAEALVSVGRVDPTTVAAASLSQAAHRSDAEPVLRQMLSAYGVPVPVDPTEDDAFAAAAVAFGWWGLPLSAFYRRLPGLDEQEPLNGEILTLLDEREHLPWVLGQERDRVEARLRTMVREAFPAPGG